MGSKNGPCSSNLWYNHTSPLTFLLICGHLLLALKFNILFSRSALPCCGIILLLFPRTPISPSNFPFSSPDPEFQIHGSDTQPRRDVDDPPSLCKMLWAPTWSYFVSQADIRDTELGLLQHSSCLHSLVCKWFFHDRRLSERNPANVCFHHLSLCFQNL